MAPKHFNCYILVRMSRLKDLGSKLLNLSASEVKSTLNFPLAAFGVGTRSFRQQQVSWFVLFLPGSSGSNSNTEAAVLPHLCSRDPQQKK